MNKLLFFIFILVGYNIYIILKIFNNNYINYFISYSIPNNTNALYCKWKVNNIDYIKEFIIFIDNKNKNRINVTNKYIYEYIFDNLIPGKKYEIYLTLVYKNSVTTIKAKPSCPKELKDCYPEIVPRGLPYFKENTTLKHCGNALYYNDHECDIEWNLDDFDNGYSKIILFKIEIYKDVDFKILLNKTTIFVNYYNNDIEDNDMENIYEKYRFENDNIKIPDFIIKFSVQNGLGTTQYIYPVHLTFLPSIPIAEITYNNDNIPILNITKQNNIMHYIIRHFDSQFNYHNEKGGSSPSILLEMTEMCEYYFIYKNIKSPTFGNNKEYIKFVLENISGIGKVFIEGYDSNNYDIAFFSRLELPDIKFYNKSCDFFQITKFPAIIPHNSLPEQIIYLGDDYYTSIKLNKTNFKSNYIYIYGVNDIGIGEPLELMYI